MTIELRHILVPLDGSRLAEAALPAATGWAARFGATLILLHIVERKPPRTVHGQAHLSGVDEARNYLEGVAERLRAGGPSVHVQTDVQPNPTEDVAAAIVGRAGELGADLIAISTHGWGGVRDLLLGNIAQQILRHGSTPVLLLRPAPDGGAPPFACGDIVVAVDPVGHGVSALVFARMLTEACGARLHLVAVVPTPGALAPERRAAAIFSPHATQVELELERQDVEARLRDAVEGARAGDQVVTLQMRRGDPVHEVVRSLAESGADLLVVATHGRAGLDGWLGGSFGPRILARSTVPVLFMRIEDSVQASG